MTQGLEDLKYSGFEDITIGQFLQDTFRLRIIEIAAYTEYGLNSCNDIEVTVAFKNLSYFTFDSTSSFNHGNFSFECHYTPEASASFQQFLKSV